MQGNLASALIRKGYLDEAEKVLKSALAADSTVPAFYYHKARIAEKRGDRREYLRQLINAASRPGASVNYLLELSEIYLRAGDEGRAHMILDTALARGLDTATVEEFETQHPELSHHEQN
jgi:tetratricopeptide (TPR) repeat protein